MKERIKKFLTRRMQMRTFVKIAMAQWGVYLIATVAFGLNFDAPAFGIGHDGLAWWQHVMTYATFGAMWAGAFWASLREV